MSPRKKILQKGKLYRVNFEIPASGVPNKWPVYSFPNDESYQRYYMSIINGNGDSEQEISACGRKTYVVRQGDVLIYIGSAPGDPRESHNSFTQSCKFLNSNGDVVYIVQEWSVENFELVTE